MTAPFFSETPAPAPAVTGSTPTTPPARAPLQDGRHDFNVVFIHSRLDDYGLPPAEFRVYAHVARRAGSGEAFPAVKSIARVCRLHPKTVRRALRVLVKHRLIRREDRPGQTAVYRLTPASEWQPPTHITDTPCQTDTPASDAEATPAKRIQGHPSQTDAAEGNPFEGNPTKAIQGPHSPPKGDCLDGTGSTSTSTQEEEIYAAYPKKVGRPVALRAIRRALVKRPFDFLLERTRLFAKTYAGETRFIPHPATWFNQDRFNDDPATWLRPSQPPRSARNGTFVPPRKFDAANYQQPVEKF